MKTVPTKSINKYRKVLKKKENLRAKVNTLISILSQKCIQTNKGGKITLSSTVPSLPEHKVPFKYTLDKPLGTIVY